MKKIQLSKNTKLKLQTETIKVIDDKKLEHVVGAGWNPTVSCRLGCFTP